MRNYIVAAIVGICFIIAFWVVARAYRYRFTSTENINVTGSAEKDFVSDLIVWNGSYSRKSMDLKEAYSMLKQDEVSITNYLRSKGVAPNEMVVEAVEINKDFNNTYDESGRQTGSVFTGYNLRQVIKLESKDVNKVEKISREITELIQSGIELTSLPPAYYYSKLSELKIDLLAKASADGHTRAETISKNSGNSLGALKKANMGVFQIVGQNSNEDYSYGGAFNTSSKFKTATITIKMEFATD
jgi:uncharacterized protein